MKQLILHLSLGISFLFFQDSDYFTPDKPTAYNNEVTVVAPPYSIVRNSIKAGRLNFTFKPDNSYYRPGSLDTHFVYTHIQADNYVPPSSQRLPLNICLVIDRSGSMGGDNIKYVKQAAEFVVNNLTPDDYLSIVVYETQVNVLLSPIKVTHKESIIQIIRSIQTTGSTNLSGGLLEGYVQIKKSYQSGYVNRVLLLSDGLANQGVTDPVQINQFAKNANLQEGITTSAFGVGINFNENLMMGIAENGSGNYYFIKNPDQIPDIFKKELNGLLSVVAQNTKVEITLPEGARMVKLYGYENQSKSRNGITVLLRDISSEEQKSFLFSYVIDTAHKTELEFSASLYFEDAINKSTPVSVPDRFTIYPTEDVELISKNIDNEVVTQYALFQANWLMEQAMQMVDKGEYNKAHHYISGNKALKTKYGAVIEKDSEFRKQDSLMTKYNDDIDNYEKMNERDKQVMQKSSKMENYSIQKKK